ncbi:cupredoxin domain-containing protein [Methanosarcina horonobensis]|uniref:hypothetical protein n=1 Tax=Methanosarcina horonobensis TaxID=418008 RepID=UPI000A8989A6|nr:hypothetical protein [Methanosarcina horonobensis]
MAKKAHPASQTETAGEILIQGVAGGVEEEQTGKTGNYNFSVNGYPNIRMTITVK